MNNYDDFIPKSVIEEKIKELKKEIERRDNEEIIDVFFDQIDVIHQIEVLQELLEKG